MLRLVSSRPNVGELDPGRAWSVLRPYWEEVKDAYWRAGHDCVARVKVSLDSQWHDTCRHYAAMEHRGDPQDREPTHVALAVHLAPELAELGGDNIMGVLAHEAGHVVDFHNPGRYWFRPPMSVPMRQGAVCVSVLDVPQHIRENVLFYFKTLPVKGLGKHMRDWDRRPKDEVELCADAIAGVVMGKPIGYTGSANCLIEALGAGVPRPKGLR